MKNRHIAIYLFFMFALVCPWSSEVSGAEPIVIGVPTDLNQAEGLDSFRAVELAVEEINARGGVSVGSEKRPFHVVSLDTAEAKPGIPMHDILAGVEKLILGKKPHAIVVGAYRSESFLAQMNLISKYKMPYLECISLTPTFEKRIKKDYDKYKNIFRVCINVPKSLGYYTQLLAHVKKEFGFKRIYFATQDTLAFQQTTKFVQKWAIKNGWESIGFDSYPTGASDFSATIAKAKRGKAQVLFVIYYSPESAILFKQARSTKLPALIAGYLGPATQESAWDTYGEDLEGIVNLSYATGQLPVQAVPKSVAFNQAYGRKYGEDLRRKLIGHGPGPAYDSVYILADAIQRAGTLDPGALIKPLEQTDMMGATGRLRFNDTHSIVYGPDPKETAVGCLFQWQKPGVRVPVFPKSLAEGKVQLPEFMK